MAGAAIAPGLSAQLNGFAVRRRGTARPSRGIDRTLDASLATVADVVHPHSTRRSAILW
jgi:hypothetical protein